LNLCIIFNFNLQGKLFGNIHADESVWTLEDGNTLNIVMIKSDYTKREKVWEALLANGNYAPDILTLHEMRNKLNLENFQIEVI
jgi:hypothetical protein